MSINSDNSFDVLTTALQTVVLENDMSQSDLSRSLNIHRSTVNKWIRRLTLPSAVLFRQVALVYSRLGDNRLAQCFMLPRFAALPVTVSEGWLSDMTCIQEFNKAVCAMSDAYQLSEEDNTSQSDRMIDQAVQHLIEWKIENARKQGRDITPMLQGLVLHGDGSIGLPGSPFLIHP